MDWRNRSYYLVHFDYCAQAMRTRFLYLVDSSIKIYTPHNHFKIQKKDLYGRDLTYDGAYIENISSGRAQMMISCKKEASEAVEYELRKSVRNSDGWFIKFEKEMLGQ